jgi:heavy metal sensor kinase
MIYDAKVSSLDAALKSQLMRAGRGPRLDNHWQVYETLLPRALETHAQTHIALLAIDRNGNTLYQSPEWPIDLKINNLWPLQPQLTPDSSPLLGQRRSSSLETNQEPPETPPFSRDRQPPMLLATQRASRETWRVGTIIGPRFRVAIIVSLEAIDREMVAISNVFLISLPVVLLLIAGGAWWLSGTALRPIQQLTTAIRQVTVKGLEQRVSLGATDVEFVELIQVFNQMLERLERNFKQASRFSGDAAHELKTPLTILQGELERTLQQAESGSEVQQSLSSLLDEVHRLSAIVRKLLLLSLADAGQMSLLLVEVNMSELLIEMTEDMELLAPHLEVHTEIAAGLNVQGDRDLLVQVLQNLIGNAIKYNLPNGWIRIKAYRQEKTVSVTISNCSKDIPANERERIFDRFHRGAPNVTHKVEGTGLGLSLAREIARAHSGELALDSTPSGETAFTLTLRSSLSK